MKYEIPCLFSDKGLPSSRVKESFEWTSAADSEEDPELQIFKPFMRRDQWVFFKLTKLLEITETNNLT